jgi:NAD(P)-dependent dehydrogenase (short-subunit alcohol dehydrogenase family)
MGDVLAGRVAIVTGAGRGFGKAIATRYAAEGAAVCVTSRSLGQLEAVVGEIEAGGGRAIAVAADCTSREGVGRIVDATEAAFGTVDILVNNAGVPDPFGPIWSVDPDAWWQAEAVHIRAPVLFLNRVMPGMIERHRGHVIIVSAIASRLMAPHLSAYCVGKTAQVRIVQHAAAEAKGQGVSLFAIDPGFVITELAERTMGSPDAQRWLPDMVARLNERKVGGGDQDGLAQCAQRCVDLASGEFDALSGGYFEMDDDLPAQLTKATATGAE